MEETDEVLVARARVGDRAAFEELVRRTSRMIFARIYLDTGDLHRTEDLVQETFIRAFRAIRKIKDLKSFRAWLLSIANSAVVDAARRERRKKRWRLRAHNQVLEELEAKTPGPEENSERAEEREKVLSILRSLPVGYRMPLMLRYLMGANYETIGRQLGLSNGSLRGLLNRGIAMLRAEMKKTMDTR